MLRILVLIFMVFSLASGVTFAGAGLFEKKDTPVQESKCSECSKEPFNLSPGLKERTKSIEKAISGNFAEKEKRTISNEIILFIDPDCRFSDAAVKVLVKFKKDFPVWNVKGVIVADAVNLKEKLLQKRSYFSNDIEFSIDLSGNLAKQFAITKSPTYVITYQGRHYKITGQPDLNETISELNK